MLKLNIAVGSSGISKTHLADRVSLVLDGFLSAIAQDVSADERGLMVISL